MKVFDTVFGKIAEKFRFQDFAPGNKYRGVSKIVAINFFSANFLNYFLTILVIFMNL